MAQSVAVDGADMARPVLSFVRSRGNSPRQSPPADLIKLNYERQGEDAKGPWLARLPPSTKQYELLPFPAPFFPLVAAGARRIHYRVCSLLPLGAAWSGKEATFFCAEDASREAAA